MMGKIGVAIWSGDWTNCEKDARALETFEMTDVRSTLRMSRLEHHMSENLRKWLEIATEVITEVVRTTASIWASG